MIGIGNIHLADEIFNSFLFGISQLAFIQAGSLLFGGDSLLNAFGRGFGHFRDRSAGREGKLRHGIGFGHGFFLLQ